MHPVRHLRFSIATLISVIGIGTLGEIPAIEKLEKIARGSQQ